MLRVILVLCLILAFSVTDAFKLVSMKKRFITQFTSQSASFITLRMSNSDFQRDLPPVVPTPPTPEEEEKVEVEKEKPAISDAMKQKLRQEIISQGGDPNFSAGPILGNPILIISGIVAILVILGGKGFFF